MRRGLGLSRAGLSERIERRSVESTGRVETVTRNVLQHVEEAGVRVPYATVCLIALGLDCNPMELLAPEAPTWRH